jgi:hypothetical protein
MPNSIKYNVSAETLALKKGNFYIGTGDVGKGPTSSTGFYNGITPPSGGYTIYLNKETGGPSIYTVTTEAELTGLTNTLSVSTNLIKNNNGGNFANGTIAPFTGAYGTLPTIVDITNDKPYNGSTSTKAAKFVAGGGMNIYTDPTPFTMTVGVTYTFSFWYRQTNANQFNIGFNNQGGSGDVNGNFQAYSDYGNFAPPTQTWQRCSWTFTNVVNKVYFFIYSANSVAGSECLMTEFTLTEGSMPGGPGLATSGNCLNWFSTQTDKIIFNRDYESIVTSGLVLNLDAGFSPSFATIPSNANFSTVTPWYDVSSGGNNGTLTNGPTYSTNGGGTIVFDGTNDLVNIGYKINLLNNDITQEAWVNTDVMVNWHGIISNMISWGTGFSLQIGPIQNIAAMVSGEYLKTSWTPSIGVWYHIVATHRSSDNLNVLYVNGVQENTMVREISYVENAVTQIGVFYTYPSLYFDGKMGPVRSYNRALSATEVLQNYNAQKGRFGL